MSETDVQELREANEEFSLVLRDTSTLGGAAFRSISIRTRSGSSS